MEVLGGTEAHAGVGELVVEDGVVLFEAADLALVEVGVGRVQLKSPL